jgi:WD40 repeat protein
VIHDGQGRLVYTTPSAEIQSATFSPDQTRVAIYSGPNDIHKLRLNVWDIENGTKLRDLWPVEWLSYPSGKPLWWEGDRWLLARYASQFSGSGIGLWDVETGRLKGTLDLTNECDAREELVASGSRLLQRCFPGKDQKAKVLEWSVDGVTIQIAAQVAGGPRSSK